MNRPIEFTHEFVEFVPKELKERILYVSIEYGTAVHRCACGCGEKVVTPFGRTDWKMIYDGDTMSLHPSIGNWNFKCRSHYWIRENHIEWAPDWSDEEIAAGRAADRAAKQRQFGSQQSNPQRPAGSMSDERPSASGGWAGVKNWWSRIWKEHR
ncbi:DUF6527 family protein [Rhodovulum sp. PH10]|uniref:DUF6527 family protein n=1 Tax=Rhodovulum sp. PH10 TaxID=1187851 RepID=UPI00058CEAB3|nr:DUF6527 family protein [Rhodovulum sp. PH10]